MRATGEFTRVEVAVLAGRCDMIKFNLDRLKELLAKKEACAAEGAAKARALEIGGALKDARFREALRSLDVAEKTNDDAARAFARCKPSRKTGKLTKTGEARQAEKTAATKAMDAARIAFRAIDREHGFVGSGGENKVGQRLSEQRLKSELRQLIDSFKIGDLPEQIEAYEEEYRKACERRRLAAASQITDSKLKAFARYLDAKPRGLLMKLGTGYTPKPATVEKLKDDYGALLESRDEKTTSRKLTNLGRDVGKWILDNEAGKTASWQPLLTPSEVRSCFTQEQLVEMADKGRRALALIKSDGPGVKNFELGLPEQGVSYRIVRTADSVQRFLKAIMSGIRKKAKKKDGPRILKKKRPTFVQGEVFEGESSPCAVA